MGVSEDLYAVLGLTKTASDDEIRKAYRRLAKENHPDLNPGDAAAEEKFKKISSAFAILGDKEKRGRYDRGEIDASGQERAPEGMYRHYADSRAGRGYQSQAGFADLGDIFGDLFGERAGRNTVRRGQDVRYNLSVDFLDAANGAKTRVTMPDGKPLDITVPAGVKDGQHLRLKGKGMAGFGGGPAGDALIEVSVKSHPLFRREGHNIHVDIPITLAEAVLGAKIKVPTIAGDVTMGVPKGANTGKVLRLKGKGVKLAKGPGRGDQYVTLKVVLPEQVDTDLEAFIEGWVKTHDYSVRQKLKV